MPYKMIRAGLARTPETLSDMYKTIATIRGSAIPIDNFDGFAREIMVFEREYGTVSRVRALVRMLVELNARAVLIKVVPAPARIRSV